MARMVSVNDIIAWENGTMSPKKEVVFFSKLVKSGMAWTLQGMYGRRAAGFIDAGILDNKGKIDWKKFDEVV